VKIWPHGQVNTYGQTTMRKGPNLLEVIFQPGFFPSGNKKGEKLPKAGGFFARKGRTIIIDRQQGSALAIRPIIFFVPKPFLPTLCVASAELLAKPLLGQVQSCQALEVRSVNARPSPCGRSFPICLWRKGKPPHKANRIPLVQRKLQSGSTGKRD